MQPDAGLDCSWLPAANFEPRRDGMRPAILLLHYTGMGSAEGALRWLCSQEGRVSCHYLIDEAGRITQMVAEAMRAWHAGDSYWAGDRDINSASIGIEIHNPGHDLGYPDFPEAQMRAVEALSRDIVARHGILPRNVLAHSDVAPCRKRDPGEKFDWARLARAGAGLWAEPAPITGDAGLCLGDEGPAVAGLQRRLHDFGYCVEAGGVYGEETAQAVTAFQRHYRTALVNGRADRSTLATLEALFAIR